MMKTLIEALMATTNYKESGEILNTHPEMKGDWTCRLENCFGEGGRTITGLSYIGALIAARNAGPNRWGWIINPEGVNISRTDTSDEYQSGLKVQERKYKLAIMLACSNKPHNETLNNYLENINS